MVRSLVARLRLLAVVSAAAVVAGCGERPTNVLLPVAETSPGVTYADMLVATTRARSDVPGEMFSGERSPGLAIANIVVSIPPDEVRTVGEVQWPKRLPGNPATDFVTVKAEEVGMDGAKAWFRRTSGKGRKVLVFVHGYNNRFEDAVYRFAQIVHDSGAEAAPLLFTWPSRGSLLAYGYDKESATYSRDALETVLTRAASEPEVGEITVMAHSMGNWVLIEALRQMAIRHGRVLPKIRNVVMAAPDVDVDVFQRQIAEMSGPHPRFTLFVSRDDYALNISSRLSGDVARLGAIDPETEPYRTTLARDGIVVVDLTKLKTGDRLNHGKFAESPEVVRLIGQRLLAGQTITDTRVSAGERISEFASGTAGAVGSGVGAILSAPIAVFDPATRATYGDRWRAVGRNVGAAAGAMTAPR